VWNRAAGRCRERPARVEVEASSRRRAPQLRESGSPRGNVSDLLVTIVCHADGERRENRDTLPRRLEALEKHYIRMQ
jgi:hypothetical protein